MTYSQDKEDEEDGVVDPLLWSKSTVIVRDFGIIFIGLNKRCMLFKRVCGRI